MNNESGYSVSGAGDVNGDGLADLIVGAPYAGEGAVGRSYVVFGKTSGAIINLSAVAMGTGGYVISSDVDQDDFRVGWSVSSAGDVNGDGLADLIMGAPQSKNYRGSSYVVFGQTSGAPVDLRAVAMDMGGGFLINGQVAGDQSGYSVSGAGDVNGDGLADLIVGAIKSDTTVTNIDAGRSYVVFGKTGHVAVVLNTVADGVGGFVINGQAIVNQSGWSVSGAGDVNGDGLADLIVGAPKSSAGDGNSYVVFGKASGTPVELNTVAQGTGGFVIKGQTGQSQSGCSVSSAGDINGDGLADLIVGEMYGDPNGSLNAGRSYVVFGKTSDTVVELSAVAAGSGGFVINGQCEQDWSGASVSGAGDVNGDGLADLIVGAQQADSSGGVDAGRSYVIFGATDGAFVQTAVDQLGSSGDNVMSDGGVAKTLVAGAGDDALSATAASVLYGGLGSDTFNISGAMITALQAAMGSGGNVDRLARIDGGSGLDTIALSGSGLTLDLTKIANPAAGDPETGSRLASIERIDLTGSGNNQLTLGAADVRALAGVNLYNSGNGWTGLEASVARHQLAVDGNSGDMLNLAGLWFEQAQVSHDGQTYRRVVRGDAELLVDTDVTLNAEVAPGITGIAITGATDAQNGLLNAGDLVTVTVTVNFSQAVTVHSSGLLPPSLALNIGGTQVKAAYDSGSGSSALVFTYKLQAGQTDSDGISIDANGISLASGSPSDPASTIRDASGNDAVLTFAGVGSNATFKVDTTAPVAPDATVLAGGVIVPPTNTEADATLEYRLKRGSADFSAWSGDYTPPVNDGTADGSYTLELRQVDLAGNVSASQTLAIHIGGLYLSDIAAGSGGFVINGQSANDYSGYSVSGAGDVDGDGLADLIVGARTSDPATGRLDAGRSYVVFGRTGTAAIELSALGAAGFVINGQGASDWSGASVSGAGDVNGDGLADLIIGASGSDPTNRTDGGRSYVVFGRTGTAAVELSALGAGGFVINGQGAGDLSGCSVSSAGDVNGDGLADLIAGAYEAGLTGRLYAGRSYVVFGRSGTTAIELSAVAAGSGGFVINGQCGSDQSGNSVSSAGDVNGDGLADLIVGAYQADPSDRSNAGSSYVVFGRSGTAAVELSVLGTGGFVINGGASADFSGWSVSGAGDVNGDGLADLIVGAYTADPTGRTNAGSSYVVFGRSDTTAIELSAVAASNGGFVINGQCANDYSGTSVSSAGDINGDGLTDLVVGAYNSLSGAGRSYVVFGRSDTTAIELSAVAAGSGGFVINGQCEYDNSGNSVSSAGDVNGDGLADLIVGANQADPTGRTNAGSSYVIFGSTNGAFSQTAVDQLGSSGTDTMNDDGVAKTLVAGAGDDSLSATAASVLYGGAGNDSFTINDTMKQALEAPLGSGGNLTQLARIDGGSGLDKIVLGGAGLTFDLTKIPQSAMNPEGVSRLSSIEVIDLTGSGNNTLLLTAKDVLDISGEIDVVDFLFSGPRRELFVTGNAGDTVNLSDATGTTGWTQDTGIAFLGYGYNGKSYYAWNSSTSNATVMVQAGMTVI